MQSHGWSGKRGAVVIDGGDIKVSDTCLPAPSGRGGTCMPGFYFPPPQIGGGEFFLGGDKIQKSPLWCTKKITSVGGLFSKKLGSVGDKHPKIYDIGPKIDQIFACGALKLP